jgi:hypothetical protein
MKRLHQAEQKKLKQEEENKQNLHLVFILRIVMTKQAKCFQRCTQCPIKINQKIKHENNLFFHSPECFFGKEKFQVDEKELSTTQR